MLTERHVQAIWYDSHLRPAVLRAVGGQAVEVVDPGRWNLEAGPDFLGALVTVNGRELAGDAEIHLHPADWSRHGHVRDPRYRGVRLHVTWFDAPPPGDLPADCVSVCIGNPLRTAADFSPDEIDLGAYPYAKLPDGNRPCTGRLGTDGTLALLRAAGRQRLRDKAEAVAARLMRGRSRLEVFYGELLSAFGYKYNSGGFRALAAAVPWRDLPADREGIRHCLGCIAEMRVAGAVPWRRANVRPLNSPERRLDSAAALLALGDGLKRRFDACDLACRSGQTDALRLMRAAGIGAHRGGAIVANVLIPFACAEGRLKAIPETIVPEDLNSAARMTAVRLFGPDHNPALYSGNSLLLQGLLHVHHVRCLASRGDCRNCPLAYEALPSTRRK